MFDRLMKFGASIRLVVKEIFDEESGGNLIEYGLILGLIGLAATATMHEVAAKIGTAFTGIHDTLATLLGNVGTIQRGS